jgi:beta-aspartyl-peptidase (threonine type)
MKPSLIVHGGAWSIPDEAVADCRAGCRRALEAGWKILERGGTALEAVEAAIVVLEDDPAFDAGIGSHLNRDGRVQLDAILMDGATLKAGAVAAVERVRNPIRLARKLLESSEHMMLVGAGAEQFAVEQGLELCQPEDLVTERERSAWSRCIGTAGHQSEFHLAHRHGTVGAVALDRQGGLVAGTSTGGTCCKPPGRVGDSPLIGCGCYADAEADGVSCTGWGEAIMKIVMAKTAADFLHAGKSAEEAARLCVELLARRGGDAARSSASSASSTSRSLGIGGLILLDRDGRPGFAFNTPRMAYAYVAADGSFVVSV